MGIPTLFTGPERFYLQRLHWLQLGLCCSCIPLAVWLRVGLNRPFALDGSPSEVLEKIRTAHHYLAEVTQADARDQN